MSLDSRERRSAWRARICDRSWSAGSATYQLYHGITDTNLTLLPLPNEFFFGVFLKHRTTLSYRTLDPSENKPRNFARPPVDPCQPSEMAGSPRIMQSKEIRRAEFASVGAVCRRRWVEVWSTGMREGRFAGRDATSGYGPPASAQAEGHLKLGWIGGVPLSQGLQSAAGSWTPRRVIEQRRRWQ